MRTDEDPKEDFWSSKQKNLAALAALAAAVATLFGYLPSMISKVDYRLHPDHDYHITAPPPE